MGRGKLTMKLIEKEKSRMITYQKRKKGLKKKAEEFATLCDVPTCMIICGPEFNNRPSEIETWPKERNDFMEVVNLYKQKSVFSIRGIKTQSMFDFFADRQRKLDEKVAKLRKANLEAKFPSGSWDDEHLNGLSIDELKALLTRIDATLEVATRRIVMLKGVQSGSQSWLLDGSRSNGDRQLCLNTNTFQTNIQQQEDIKLRQQLQRPISSMKPQLSTYYNTPDPQVGQILPFALNPMIDPMMMNNNCGELTHFSSMAYPQLQHPMYVDPMTAMLDNVMLYNNPRPLCYYGSSSTAQPLQSLQPYEQSVPPSFSSQPQMENDPQFNHEFHHEINQYGIKSQRGNL